MYILQWLFGEKKFKKASKQRYFVGPIMPSGPSKSDVIKYAPGGRESELLTDRKTVRQTDRQTEGKKERQRAGDFHCRMKSCLNPGTQTNNHTQRFCPYCVVRGGVGERVAMG